MNHKYKTKWVKVKHILHNPNNVVKLDNLFTLDTNILDQLNTIDKDEQNKIHKSLAELLKKLWQNC